MPPAELLDRVAALEARLDARRVKQAPGRLDRLEQRLDIFESDISAQAMAPGGLHGGITDRRTPKQKESDQRRAAALEKKFGRKSGLLQQATQGAGGGQPCGASHIAPALTCHKGQGDPAGTAPPGLSLTQATGLSNFVRSWRKSGGDETIAKKRRITAYAAEQGLDDLELGAVIQYTRTGYRDINGALRGQARPHADMKDDEALAYAELVKGALQKLPEVKHAVWRGVSMDPEQLAQFKVGRVGGDPGFQSTTAESPYARKGYDGVAVAFSSGALDGESRAHQVVFEYAPGHGARSIRRLTGTDEQEALVAPGQQFRVAEVRPFGEVLRQRLGEDVDWGDELDITLVRLEPVRRPRRDGLEDRLSALQERLDARVKQAPGQMGLDLSAGSGVACGASYISKDKECHKGQGAAGAERPGQLSAAAPQKATIAGPLTDQQLADSIYWISREAWIIDERKTMTNIYRLRGWDGKPELVETEDDLRQRDDLIANNGGWSLVLHRGFVNDREGVSYAEDFRSGPDNFVGRGIHGSGSYAAEDRELAKLYTAVSGPGAAAIDEKNMVAFGIKSTANIRRHATTAEAEAFEREITDTATDRATRVLGRALYVYDLGLAAAIEGVEAYNAEPQAGRRRQWVVLNRASVVAARKYEWT